MGPFGSHPRHSLKLGQTCGNWQDDGCENLFASSSIGLEPVGTAIGVGSHHLSFVVACGHFGCIYFANRFCSFKVLHFICHASRHTVIFGCIYFANRVLSVMHFICRASWRWAVLDVFISQTVFATLSVMHFNCHASWRVAILDVLISLTVFDVLSVLHFNCHASWRVPIFRCVFFANRFCSFRCDAFHWACVLARGHFWMYLFRKPFLQFLVWCISFGMRLGAWPFLDVFISQTVFAVSSVKLLICHASWRWAILDMFISQIVFAV